MSPENRSVQVNLRLQPTLKVAAEKAAAQDHRSLTSLIEKLLADHLRAQPTLEDWHERALAQISSAIADKKTAQGKLGLMARSYCFHTADGDRVHPAALVGALRAINFEHMIPGQNVFHVYRNKPELLPYFTSDGRLARNQSDEILEFTAIDALNRLGFWRVSPLGMATDVSDHREDRENTHFSNSGLEAGTWFWPEKLTQNLAELIFHATFFAEKFPSVERVEFRCEWSGLSDRQLSDPDRMGYRSGKVARVDRRVTTGEWPVLDLRRSWAEIVSELGAPVLRLFDPSYEYSPESIVHANFVG
jgi:hypothetical protein